MCSQCTHSHTDGGVNLARRQPARGGQSGFGVLLREISKLNYEEPRIELAALPPEFSRLISQLVCKQGIFGFRLKPDTIIVNSQ